MTNNNITSPESMISPEALALLGGGKIAYVKMIRAEDVQRQFPQAPQLAPGSRWRWGRRRAGVAARPR